MSDERLSPLTEWMVKVVAEVAARPWMRSNSHDQRWCGDCGFALPNESTHMDSCPFLRLEELLRQKPVVQGKAEP